MTAPVRMQLSRRKGFNLQVASDRLNGRKAVHIARPGPWGNPFTVGIAGTRAECVHFYRILLSGYIALTIKGTTPDHLIAHRKFVAANIGGLHGMNLACWCSGSPCHGDVLLALANARAA